MKKKQKTSYPYKRKRMPQKTFVKIPEDCKLYSTNFVLGRDGRIYAVMKA